ncbi:hypothetical protein Tco_0070787 [Tanacetum coccineum]
MVFIFLAIVLLIGSWPDGGGDVSWDDGGRRLDGGCQRLGWWSTADGMVVAVEMRWWWEVGVIGFMLEEERGREFAQIFDIPCEGACVFTDKWSLDELAYGVPVDGPYQTNPPSPDDIISYIRNDREGQVTRIRHEEQIDVQDHQILTREIVSTLKPLEEIIWENVFCLGGNWDHVPACLYYMLYCVANSEKFNLAFYMAKIIEWVTKESRLILPYGVY